MKVIGFLIILSIIFVIPVADAQLSIGAKAVQKSVEVIINSDGEVHVKHVVISSNSPSQVELIEGTVSNLVVTNEQGKEKEFIVVGDKNGLMIFPSQRYSIIEYNLVNLLSQKDYLWPCYFIFL